jgi:hypothetical protein
MFEEIEKANDGREVVIAPQNHPDIFVSFVWDNTVRDDAAGVEPL